jgi:negative regulator of sigma E activity
MNEPLNEQLSALLDGELAPEETELLMKRLARDSGLRATLGRYALCGEALRATAPFSRPRADLASRISAAIMADPTPAPVARTPSRVVGWLKPVAGLAVAATVAALAVLVLGRAPGSGTVAPSVVAVNATPTAPLATAVTTPTAAPLGAGGTEPASYITPAARRATVAAIPAAELANYLVAHAQYSSLFARRAVMSGLIDGPPPAQAAAPAALAAPAQLAAPKQPANQGSQQAP